MRVFLAGTSFAASYGGPAISVSRLAVALAERGVEVGLWAPDQTATAAPLSPAGTSVVRLAGTVQAAMEAFGSIDIIHDNGLWLPHNHELAVIGAQRRVPRVVSIRGMLEPWARRHKWLKKTVAWGIYQKRDLNRAHVHHATSAVEAQGIRTYALSAEVVEIPNGIDLPSLDQQNLRGETRCSGSPKTALFLGRLHPVKGLPLLIEAWARVRPEGWRLEIVGPDEGGHRAQIERMVSSAGLEASVSFAGPLDEIRKTAAFDAADLFVLPSHSESFGMAIAEALAHGLPVLTTKGAPWPMLPTRGCGWQVETSTDGVAGGLAVATQTNPETLSAMGARGKAFVASEFGWPGVAQRFVETYERAILDDV